jgi:hypothetical protein
LNTSKVKAKNVNIKAGVDKDNLENAGNVSAEVSSVKASAGVYTATATLQQAVSNAVTNIELASGASVEADEQLNVLSSLNRTATTGSTSANIGLLSIGA